MIPERRKSFYDAKRRITECAKRLNSSQSTIAEEKKIRTRAQPTRAQPKRTQPTRSQPTRSQPTRSKGSNAPVISSTAINKRQTRSSKTKPEKVKRRRNAVDAVEQNPSSSNEHQELAKYVPEEEIPRMRSFVLKLDKMSDDFVNRHLLLNRPPMSQSMSCDSDEARKIINRRCTVNLDRADLSASGAKRTIDENENQIEPQLPVHPPTSEVEDDVATFYESDHESSSVISNQNRTLLLQEESMDTAYGTQNEASGDEEQETMDVDSDGVESVVLRIDVELAQLSSSLQAQVSNHRGEEIRPVINVHTQQPEYNGISVNRMDLDLNTDETHATQDASTQDTVYFSELPQRVTTQEQRTSQTLNYVRWNITGSLSNPDAAQGPSSENDISREGSTVEPKKCFIDSSLVSYGAFIEYKAAKFAINRFDHGDESIQDHFLSKFDRAHFSALSTMNGYLWTSETTAKLIRQYSKIDANRIKVLQYDTPVHIDSAPNISVTAIETPEFPGGALFLFQASDEKSIIHVGNFRLPNELESNATLMKNDIDEVRFDESILSQLFYQFDPRFDRYVHLFSEIDDFIKVSRKNGLSYMIVAGAFEIGMESFIYKLANNFSLKVHMSTERRAFLDHMVADDDDDTMIQNLLRQTVADPEMAMLHILQVDEISYDFLMRYINQHNYQRVLGIRPRGCDIALQTVTGTGPHQIIDIANPLIGDLAEYERFVEMNISKSVSALPSCNGENHPAEEN